MREARKPILGNTQMVGEHHEATKVGIQRNKVGDFNWFHVIPSASTKIGIQHIQPIIHVRLSNKQKFCCVLETRKCHRSSRRYGELPPQTMRIGSAHCKFIDWHRLTTKQRTSSIEILIKAPSWSPCQFNFAQPRCPLLKDSLAIWPW